MRKKQMIAAGALLAAALVVLAVCLTTFGKKKGTADAENAAAGSEALETEGNGLEEAEEKSEKKKQDAKRDQTKEEETETGTEEEETQMEATPMVQSSGLSVSGTSAEDSFDIPMSDLYTFTDPSLSFDTRYVLYGGSGCMMAKQAGAQGYTCIGAYEILYTSGGRAAAEYKFWVMGSVSDAIGWEAYMSPNYNDSNCSISRHGDVVCLYTKGSYVQESYIDFYYKQGVIESATAKAYLKMPFFFNGMSDYHGSGNKPSGGSETPDPAPAPGPSPTPGPAPAPGPQPSGDDKENSKDIPITGSYTFKDPEGLDFDIRYVLVCEDKNASAVKTVADMAKADIVSVYEILYVKNGKAVAEYKCYVAADDAQAKKIADTYQMPDGLHGDVMILCNDKAMLDQMMDIGVKYGYISAATPEAYIHYLMSTEGFKEYKGDGGSAPLPDPKPVPGPGPDPTPDPAPGPPVEEFVPDFKEIPTVQITKDYSFTDPDGLDYAVRFGAYGGKDCPFAVQYQAVGYSDMIYADQEGKAAAEYKFYVMENEDAARTLREQFAGYGADAALSRGTVVCVAVSGKEAQDNIDVFAQYGQIPKATVKAYFDTVAAPYGLTVTEAAREWKPDLTKKPVIQITKDYAFTDPDDVQYDARYAAYGGKECPYAAQAGAEGFCEILYSENGKAAAEYKLYIMADEGAAKAQKETMAAGGMDVTLSRGNVVCAYSDGEYIQQTIDLYVQYGLLEEATAKAYLDAMFGQYGLEFTEAAYGKEPEEPESQKPVATDKANSPAFQMGGNHVFENPDDLDFDSRYVLYGGPESGAFGMVAGATQADIKEMYEVLYVKDGRPAAEYKCYVTANEAEAQKILTAYGTMVSTEHDVAIMYSSGENVEQTIAMYAQYGGLTDPTPAGYLQFMIDNENLKPVVPPEAPAPVRSAGDQEADEGQKEKALQEAAEPEAEAEPKTGAEPEAEAEAAQPAAQTEEEEPVSKVPAAALLETAEDVARKADREEDDEPAEEEEPVHEDEPEQTEEPKQQEGPAAEEGAGPGEGLDEA